MSIINQSQQPVNPLVSLSAIPEGSDTQVIGAAAMPAVTCVSVKGSSRIYSPIVQQWSEFLSQYNWNWWATFTFRDPKHPEAAAKIYDNLIHMLSKEIFGNRYYKRKNVGVIWARATENQELRAYLEKKDVIHYHAVLGNIPGTVRRLDYMDYWDKIAGHARIMPFEKGVGAEGYLSKSCYAWKRGEIDLGGPMAVPVNGSAVLFG